MSIIGLLYEELIAMKMALTVIAFFSAVWLVASALLPLIWKIEEGGKTKD